MSFSTLTRLSIFFDIHTCVCVHTPPFNCHNGEFSWQYSLHDCVLPPHTQIQEYPDFYIKLYSLLQPSTLYSAYRHRFLVRVSPRPRARGFLSMYFQCRRSPLPYGAMSQVVSQFCVLTSEVNRLDVHLHLLRLLPPCAHDNTLLSRAHMSTVSPGPLSDVSRRARLHGRGLHEETGATRCHRMSIASCISGSRHGE